jgi:hypothetical protein
LLLFTALLLSFSATGYAANSTTKVKVDVGVDKNKNGLPDSWELKFNLTGKNVANGDADGDGIPNIIEFLLNLNPRSADSDHDGIKDGNEDYDHDGLTNLAEIKLHDDPTVGDTDHDGILDGDEDQDGDGLSNYEEFVLNENPASSDSDHDGIKDGDEDLNKDGKKDGIENIHFNAKTDTNLNGIPDSWEIQFKLAITFTAYGDDDKDGISNYLEFLLKLNPESSDSDHDGIKDNDEDNDGDGLSNEDEVVLGDNPDDSDSDNDGVSDGNEDNDGDGISNIDDGDINIDVNNDDHS